MLELIYPDHLQELFTNRERELRLLEFSKEELMEGKQLRLSFFGLRRIGKSLILKEFLRRNLNDKKVRVVYLNLEEFTTNPEDFALNYIARTCFWALKGERLEDFLIPERLLITVPEEVREQIMALISLLKEDRVDRTSLLNLSFSFPSILAEALDIRIIMLLDEFQEILGLKRFRDCRSILNLLRAKIEAKDVNYVIAGSAASVIHDLVGNHRSPLFNQFKEESIGFFDKITTRELIGKSMRGGADIKDLIYELVDGHPFYINAITARIRILNSLFNLKTTKGLIKRAFIIETLSRKGDIYKHCEYIYNTSLERARYGVSLKGILKILAKNEGLNQSQISRRLRVTQGAGRSYLNALIDVDILLEKDGCYFFRDRILRYWLSYREFGIELDEFPKERILEDIVKELEEKYLKASTELGRAKEFEIKAKLEKKLEMNLENYSNKDGQIEFDLVGKKNNLTYIFEIKWRNKPSTRKDLKRFLEKVKSSEFSKGSKKLFFISRSGFTEGALRSAESGDIEVLDANLEGE